MGETEDQALTIQRRSLKRWGIWRSSTHKKRREDERNWITSSYHPKKIPQSMRNMKNSTLEELHIHLSFWIRNDAIMNEEDDEAEGSRSLPMKQIKVSIQFSFHDIMHLFIFSWCVMHDRMFALMTVYYYYACYGCYTNLHCYLSRMKPLCWHIGLVHNLNVFLVEMEGI